MRPSVITLLQKPFLANQLPTLIRITLGVLLVYHGSLKIFEGMDAFVLSIAEKGWPMPMMQAFLAAYTEFMGGVLLIVGLMTRPAAFASTILFSVIFFVFSAPEPFMKKEKALLFLVLSVYTFLMGPGAASVDALILRNAQSGPQQQR